MVFVNKSRCWQFGLVSVLVITEATLSASLNCLLAQIVPDGTLGDESSTIAPNAEVKGLPAQLIEGGAARGSNLFHSFAEFNVGELQRVYFANPTGIENILSRVTGNNPSDIMGTLGVDGAANLFLINPNGIVFGSNAQLDITGSFLASTANSLIWNNGFEFSATNPEAPPLLTINLTPGLQYGSGATIANRGNLAVGQDLTLSAGNLDLQGQLYAGRDLKLLASDTVRVRDSAANPFIAVADNQLLVQGNQGVDIFALNHPTSGFFSGGDMVLRSAIPVTGDAHYWSGGNFQSEQLDGSLGDLFSSSDPIIRSQGDVSFQSYQGASLHILAGGSVNIGNVTINGTDSEDSINETVTLSDGTTTVTINGNSQPTLDIRAGTTVTGSPIPTRLTVDSNNSLRANIAINSIKVTQPNGLVFLTNQYQPNQATSGEIQVGEIRTDDSFGGFSGNSGDVIIDSRGDITLPSFATINTSSSTGNAGDVYLIANEFISLTNGASVNSATFGVGKAGDIEIQAGTVSINNGTLFSEVARGATGTGGNLTVETKNLILRDGATIVTTTVGEGAGGNLTVNASESVELIGVAASGFPPSVLVSQTAGAGDAGDLTITTGKLIVRDGAFISSSTFGEHPAGNLTVTASESVKLMGTRLDPDGFVRSSGLFTETQGTGNAGNLRIETPKLIVQDGANVNANTFSGGQAGDLTIISSESVELSGIKDEQISGVFASTLGIGDAGNLKIETGKLTVRDGAQINTISTREGRGGDITIIASESVELLDTPADAQFANGVFTQAFGAGDGGNLSIKTKKLVIKDGSFVSSGAFRNFLEPGQEDSLNGQAGNVTIVATDSVELSGTSGNFRSNASSQTEGSRDAGDVRINTAKLIVRDGAIVSTGTSGDGSGGNLTVTASEFVELSGVKDQFPAELSSQTQGDGNAGKLRIDTEQLILRDGGQISVSTFGNGNAGNLIVNASESVKIIGNEPVGLFDLTTGIFAQAVSGSEGNGGRIEINTGSLVLTEGSEITTRTAGKGNAGNITLKVEDSINITGADTGIFADTEQGSTGDGGSIFIDPETIILQDGASIAVNSQGSGEGGNIQLQAGSLTLERGMITAETASNQGGNINLQLFDLLTLRNNSQISATAGTAQAEGDGGNIDINAPFILSFPEENNITAEAFLGTGGNINITTNSIFGREFLEISASSQLGLEGTVSINILELELSPGLVELPSGLETLSIPQGCEASRGRGSSFISSGRGGLPPSPTETLSSGEVWKDVQLPTQLSKNSANTTKQSNSTAERIVEATSWIINEEGIVELVAEESSDTHQGSCR